MSSQFRMGLPRMTPVAKRLLILVLGAYIGQLILDVWLQVGATQHLVLNYTSPGIHSVWQVFTHILAYPASTHPMEVLITLLFMWWMVAPFEERYGSQRTIQLVFVAALASAIPALVAGLFLSGGPGFLAGFNPVLLAVIAAVSISMRNQMLSFFGVIPLKGIHLLWLVVGFSVLNFIWSTDFVQLVGSLGAVGGGILFIRNLTRPPRGKPRKKGRRRSGVDWKVIKGGADDPDRPRYLN